MSRDTRARCHQTSLLSVPSRLGRSAGGIRAHPRRNVTDENRAGQPTGSPARTSPVRFLRCRSMNHDVGTGSVWSVGWRAAGASIPMDCPRSVVTRVPLRDARREPLSVRCRSAGYQRGREVRGVLPRWEFVPTPMVATARCRRDRAGGGGSGRRGSGTLSTSARVASQRNAMSISHSPGTPLRT
jgi:hypothetical protein